MNNWRTIGTAALTAAGLLASIPASADTAGEADGIDTGFLRLVPPGNNTAPDGLLPTTNDEVLATQLPVSPRYGGLELSLTDDDIDSGVVPGLSLGFGHRIDDIGISVFGTIGGGTHRDGLAAVAPMRFGSGNYNTYAIETPEPQSAAMVSDYRFGGQLAYGGLAFGVGFAQDLNLRDGTSFNDYRLGLSYGLDNWRVGLNYTRSLSLIDQQRTSEFADALELGGSWQLSEDFMLRGGVQYWEQSRVDLSTDTSSGVIASEATIFFGTRLRF